MLNVSSAFKTALANDWRKYLINATITLQDGSTVLTITNEDLMASGNNIEDGLCDDSSFGALGGAPIGSITLRLNNVDATYSAYDFTRARVVLRIGLEFEDGTTEMINRGEYFVSTPTYTDTAVSLYCLDNMYRLDYPYDSDLVYPASLGTIVRDICSEFGLDLNTQNFPQNSFVVNESPANGQTTYREVLSWCAEIAGCYVRCDVNGGIIFGWYDQTILEDYYDDDDSSRMIQLDSISEQNLGLDDIIITGVVLKREEEETTTVTQTLPDGTVITYDQTSPVTHTYTYGTTDYAIELNGKNAFITAANAQTIVNRIGAQLTGIRYRKANVSHLSLPYMQAGDIALLTDRKGNKHVMLITRTVFIFGSYQQTASAGKTVAQNSSVQYSALTKQYSEARQEIYKEVQARQAAVAELAAKIAEEGTGLYATQVESPAGSGSYIYYYHNKPELADSDIQLVFSTVGFTVTANGTDPNPTWYGFTVDGTIVANMLNTNSVSATWISTGQLSVHKTVGGQDVEMLFVDVDTGTVRISDQVQAIDDARKVATNYLTYDANVGLDVGYNTTNAKTRITGNGVEIFDANGESSAKFGTTVRIGKEDTAHILFDEDTQTFFDKDQAEIGKLGVQDDAIVDVDKKLITMLKEQSVNTFELLPLPKPNINSSYHDIDGVRYFDSIGLTIYASLEQTPSEYTTVAGGTRISLSEDGNVDIQYPTFDLYDDGDIWSTISATATITYSNTGTLSVSIEPQTSDVYYYHLFVQYIGEDKSPYFKFGPTDNNYSDDADVYKFMGSMSTATGHNTFASGMYSFAGNRDTIALGKYQTVIGTCNAVDTANGYAFIIGNGTRGHIETSQSSEIEYARRNAFAVDWAGGIVAGLDNEHGGGVLLPDLMDHYEDVIDVQNLIGKGLRHLQDPDATFTISGNYSIFGQYNKQPVNSDYYSVSNPPFFVIGNGAGDTARSNIFEAYAENAVFYKKTIFNSGIAIKYAPKDTAPDFFLTLHETFASGGTVGWIAKTDMPAAIGMGTVSVHNGSSTSVPTATDTTMCNSGSLSAGTYIIKAVVQFATNTNGRRVIFLTKSSTGANIDRYTLVQSAPSPSNTTYVELTYITTITTATTYYLRAYQNSGSTLSCLGGIEYVKLHN